MENKLISSSSDVTTYSSDEEEILLYPENVYKRSTIPNSFKNHWLLNQNNHDSSSNISITDHSDIEFSGNETDDDDLFSVSGNPPSLLENMEQFQSTINCYLNQIKNKRSKRKLFLCPAPPDDDKVANATGNGTDDEVISISGTDFRQIVNEEFENNHGGKESADIDDHKFMTVKTHQSQTTTKTNKIKPIYHKEIEKIPPNLLILSEDSTDESDLDVSMKDYYKIRHQNQKLKKLQVDYIIFKNKPKISSNQKFNNLETSEEDEVDILADSKRDPKLDSNDNDDTSCESEVEVNMKDYYVIRHETAAKSVSGPVEIDFGYAISHQSFLKGGRGKKFVKKRNKTSSSTRLVRTGFSSHVPKTTTGKGNTLSMTADNNFTDVEELADNEEKNKLMTYQEFLESLKISRSEQSLAKKSTSYKDGNSAAHTNSDLSDDSNSLAANSNFTDNEAGGSKTDILLPEYSKKLVPPIIRLIEVEGLQGAVGVICQKNSPTSDDVYGIKFLQNEEEQGPNHLLL